MTRLRMVTFAFNAENSSFLMPTEPNFLYSSEIPRIASPLAMDLHVFFFPFLAPGHMNPMVDLARLFADRGVKATIITTTANVPRIQPTIHHANPNFAHPIQILTIPFPSSESGLPDGHENLLSLPTSDVPPAFHSAIALLEQPFRLLCEAHHPDFIISDVFYPWTSNLGIPRIEFHGTSFFSSAVLGFISYFKPHAGITGDSVPFVVPNIPHHIEVTLSQLPDHITKLDDHTARITAAQKSNYGSVMNSVYEMEPLYADLLKEVAPMKIWQVGPVSLCHRDEADRAVRGDKASMATNDILSWLNDKNPSSVLYVCFGSLGKFIPSQLAEIAFGLEASGHPFIWVINGALPEGFEERVVRKGLIIKGWAPQILILNHTAIGGFMTHCGWNSCMEGASAGLPMITWPLFAEQFLNEKLIVDVLRIGIAVGSKVSSDKVEERTVVSMEAVKRAVEGLMGSGEEADGRRERARELGEKARKAMEEGGSSYNEMSRMIEDLVAVKAASARV